MEQILGQNKDTQFSLDANQPSTSTEIPAGSDVRLGRQEEDDVGRGPLRSVPRTPPPSAGGPAHQCTIRPRRLANDGMVHAWAGQGKIIP